MESGTNRPRQTESSPLLGEDQGSAKKKLIAVAVVTGLVALGLGILIGFFSAPTKEKTISNIPLNENDEKLRLLERLTKEYYKDDDEVTKIILKEIKPENIRQFTKHLSAEPHLEGSERNLNLSYYIRDQWIQQGLDHVELVPYKVLLSYPNMTKPNMIHIMDKDGNYLFNSTYIEDPILEEEQDPKLVHAYHGLAPKGDVIGDPVYVNYGRVEDFEYLESKGIDVNGTICIVRYGKIFRGNKVANAAARGAVGVIIYSDPAEVAREGTEPEKLYPYSWWMPDTAMQRGSVYASDGDPLTPGYPAVEGAYRYNQKEADLPKIPSQPIGYRDAYAILSKMDGEEAPSNWTGQLNITYRVGPGFDKSYDGYKLRMVLNNYYKNVTIYNVIGTIKGNLEPDRYVITGNHRDAWGYGALDAVSGTSPLMEVTRVFGNMKKDGWRPRRTMVFCSWGGEEFGLMGSTEWVEEHVQKLMREAVAVVNIDTCVKGEYFNPSASPSLMGIIRQAAKKIPDPIQPSKSVYDTWKEYQDMNATEEEPHISTLGSGTDHASFAFYAGIPGINLEWRYNTTKYPISGYPAYHTGYETFYLVDNITDPGFVIHRSCGQMIGILNHILADSTFLPYNFVELGDRLISSFETLREEGILEQLEKRNIKTDFLERALHNFSDAANKWHEKNVTEKDPLLVRQVNDLTMSLERVFIKPEGLPNRPLIRHVAFAPSQYDQYSQAAFPAITDLLNEIEKLEPEEQNQRWKQIEKHISDLMLIVNSATETLTSSFLM